jgi:hypothetical protein
MTDAWRKRLDDEGDTLVALDAHGAVRIGANQEKRQLAFIPASHNRTFNKGRGVSFEYAHLLWVDFELDYSEVVLNFTTDCVTLQGRDLKGLYDQIRAHVVDLVEQSDPMHALAEPLRFHVTGLLLGPPREREYS